MQTSPEQSKQSKRIMFGNSCLKLHANYLWQFFSKMNNVWHKTLQLKFNSFEYCCRLIVNLSILSKYFQGNSCHGLAFHLDILVYLTIRDNLLLSLFYLLSGMCQNEPTEGLKNPYEIQNKMLTFRVGSLFWLNNKDFYSIITFKQRIE